MINVHTTQQANAVGVNCDDDDWYDDDPYWYAWGHFRGYHYYDSDDRRAFDRRTSLIRAMTAMTRARATMPIHT